MSHPGREIELKFLCAPEDLPAVLAAAPAGDDQVRELISVYFDTPDRALERAGVSLRVRESGGRRIQTLKRGKGLTREEHEQPVEGFAPDPTTEPLCDILPAEGAAALAPAFYVGVHRRQRLVRYGASEIEIALDQGEVRAGEGKSPISEVELELKSGSLSALFDLARELSAAAPLYLSFDGKASVGQALTAGGKPGSRRRTPMILKRGATTAEAFQATARAALGLIAGNAQMLRAAASSEAVHQLRVATRRLRSALTTFAPLVEDVRRDLVKAELRWLAKACDEARDLDVFAAGARANRKVVKAPGLAPLLTRVDAERGRAAEEVREVVASERFRDLLLEVAAWVETGPWLDDPDRARLRDTAARSFAAVRLERQLHKFRKRAKGFARADDAGRHEVRIEAKKLRYAAEAFGSLFPPKRVAAFVRPLKALQGELGALNDAAVAERLSGQLASDTDGAFAAGELAGLRLADQPHRIAEAAAAMKQVASTRPFWR